MKIALSVPKYGQIDTGTSVPNVSGQKVIWTLVELILILAILLAIWFILRGGWDMITSEGQKEKIANARKEILFALLGLVLIFLSFFFINVIGSAVGANLLSLPF